VRVQAESPPARAAAAGTHLFSSLVPSGDIYGGVIAESTEPTVVEASPQAAVDGPGSQVIQLCCGIGEYRPVPTIVRNWPGCATAAFTTKMKTFSLRRNDDLLRGP
jgi:hypothetical protein